MLDYYGVEADLSEEERMIQESAREFVDEKVRPDIGEHWIE
ncbi:acyl-CoA dehydrogenase, partial [Halorientalis pallida]